MVDFRRLESVGVGSGWPVFSSSQASSMVRVWLPPKFWLFSFAPGFPLVVLGRNEALQHFYDSFLSHHADYSPGEDLKPSLNQTNTNKNPNFDPNVGNEEASNRSSFRPVKLLYVRQASLGSATNWFRGHFILRKKESFPRTEERTNGSSWL